LGAESLRVERGVDLRAAGEREVVRDDRVLRDRGERERLDLRERMAARDEHAAIPLVAGQGDEVGERCERFGRDADVGFAARRLLGDLHRIALVQLELHLR
jgi:hypothetical protein